MTVRERLHANEHELVEAILFGVVPHGDERGAAEALAELAELADTGEFAVAGCMAQHRRHPDPQTYLGAGKLEELAEAVAQTGARVVIADDQLSPAQGRNIEETVKAIVLDRAELILHIFGIHARTPQARLQVELARLQYQVPRLKRMWTHLERQRGGIAVRGGAGEKQIDVDRSEIRARIAALQRDLEKIEGRKVREVRTRADRFTVALVGYTNAGKSTLMNRLTDAGVLAEDRLFSTLDTRTRPWRLPGGRVVLLSDTVGFIRKLPHQLVASFHATLEEALNADLLFVLVDGSSPHALQQLQVVEEVLEHLGAAHIPRIHVLNKADRISDRSVLTPIRSHGGVSVLVSALTGDGLPGLEAALLDHLASVERDVVLLVPHGSGALRAEVRRLATVLGESFDETGSAMTVRASAAAVQQLIAKGARLGDQGGPSQPD
ncbi:MAG: GTPase HflX [Planctomycetes bacterium]|nr:GTPase HflX [Planctomycetota bacterium]